MTGHFSIDFLLDEDDPEPDLMKKIYPIECNPRAHTAVVLFADEGEDMSEAYLSILPDHKPKKISNNHRKDTIVMPSPSSSYYWIGHDIITLMILPFWAFFTMKTSLTNFVVSWLDFLDHLLLWKDGTYEIWDPWPMWWLYCVYWPGMFLVAILTRSWWSRCNVSTTKMFRC